MRMICVQLKNRILINLLDITWVGNMGSDYIRLICIYIILLNFLVSIIGVASCVPASPYPIKFIQPDNSSFYGYVRGDEWSSYIETSGYIIQKDDDQWWKYVENDPNGNIVKTDFKVGKVDPKIVGIPDKNNLQRNLRTPLLRSTKAIQLSTEKYAPAVGSAECVVLLIEFTDVKANKSHTSSFYNDLLFNSKNPKSLKSYYNEVSYGKLNVKGIVSKWYQSSKTMEYYGEDRSFEGSDDKYTNIYELARETVRLASKDIDFSKYDTNGDHVVEHVIIVHAGDDQSKTGIPDDIWSCQWTIPGGEEVNGVKVKNFTLQSESSPMGTFAHEFGHDLGLPDLYDTTYNSYGVGYWDIMGYGGSLGNGSTPAHFSAWSKYFLGWVNPIKVTSPTWGEKIANVETNSQVYMFLNNNVDASGDFDWNMEGTGRGEYFLVENRKKTGFDTFLPGEGLLIWHIDQSMPGNKDKNHKLVDLEQADGQHHLDDYINLGDANDCWVNSMNGFSVFSNPNSNLYNGEQSGVGVENIGPAGSTITADLLFNNTNQVSPVAAFSATPITGNAPLIVAFTDMCSGSPTSWSWDFGDGTNSTEQNPTHTYSLSGTYTVTLVASNAAGSNTTTESNHITVINSLQPPVAAFSATPTTGIAPLNVAFTDLSSGSPSFWSWDFGDGNYSTDQNPTHIYFEAGTYSVNLKVSNTNGTASQAVTITVQSSSDSGSSHSSGLSGSADFSPELKDNIKNKESSKAFVVKSNYIDFDFPMNATPVVNIAFEAKVTAGMTKTIVEELKQKSILVSYLPSDEIYKSINIWAGNNGFITPKKIESAVVNFKVEKSWMMERSINRSSVTLNRYSENKWNSLPTSLSAEDDNYLYFTAETPGFSSFAITGKNTSINAISASTDKTQLKSVNEIKSKSTNGITITNNEHILEQNQSTNNYGKDGTQMPGFTTVFVTFSSIMIMSACFLYFFLKK
jgi:M6 family metalloprotease-like protein/PGF-pre-PGF domain-containing protein